MSFKPTLTKIAGLTLLLSSGLNAAPLFETASSSESFKAEAQVNQLAATKPSVENAYVYNVNAKALSASTNQLELNLVPGLTVFANKESSSKSAAIVSLPPEVTKVTSGTHALTNHWLLLT